jgi:hypothetical protein
MIFEYVFLEFAFYQVFILTLQSMGNMSKVKKNSNTCCSYDRMKKKSFNENH